MRGTTNTAARERIDRRPFWDKETGIVLPALAPEPNRLASASADYRISSLPIRSTTLSPSMTFPQPNDVAVDEKLAAFDSVPLFMKSLPDDALDDPVVSALQSLAHEGTPDGE